MKHIFPAGGGGKRTGFGYYFGSTNITASTENLMLNDGKLGSLRGGKGSKREVPFESYPVLICPCLSFLR